jgi:hypothetical protein
MEYVKRFDKIEQYKNVEISELIKLGLKELSEIYQGENANLQDCLISEVIALFSEVKALFSSCKKIKKQRVS